MKWYAISGTWRLTNEQIKKDVVKEVRKIIDNGDGIVTWWALGVDYFATQVVLDCGDVSTQLKLCLPINLKSFCQHYKNRADEDVITQLQAKKIVEQLLEVEQRGKKAIYDDWWYDQANQESYFARNSEIIKMCDVLYAFQVNGSKWTQDSINKARELGKEVIIKKYVI